MKSRVIKHQDGTEKRYYRYPQGNDIISDKINNNAYWGPLASAPDSVVFVVDGSNYYYKNDNGEWQKLYLKGGEAYE